MNIYAIKNVDGKLLDVDGDVKISNSLFGATTDYQEALDCAKRYGGHIVQLVEKPAPVVVSEEEDTDLRRVLRTINQKDAVSSPFSYLTQSYGQREQRRLLRALNRGWTVAKTKRYVLPMDGTLDEFGKLFAVKYSDGHWDKLRIYENITDNQACAVTQSDIDTAPDWVKAIKPVEVRDEKK